VFYQAHAQAASRNGLEISNGFYKAFAPAEAKRILDKLEFHYTPTHGSWLNMAEIELSVLTRQCLNQRIPDLQQLQREVTAWEKRRNRLGRTIDWRFTTDDARIKLKGTSNKRFT
jgi:hypothetical protein